MKFFIPKKVNNSSSVHKCFQVVCSMFEVCKSGKTNKISPVLEISSTHLVAFRLLLATCLRAKRSINQANY